MQLHASDTPPPSSSPATSAAASLQLPPLNLSTLPASVYQLGFTQDHFDPQAIYESTQANKANYNDIPSDVPDEHLFNADPKQIAYGNILRLAAKYPAAEIYRRVNEGRPQPVFKSPQMVESRIKSAMKWAPDHWGNGWNLGAVGTWLEQERAKNGIMTRGEKRAREESAAQPSKSNLETSTFATPRKRMRTDVTSPPPVLERPGAAWLLGPMYRDHVRSRAPNPYLNVASAGTETDWNSHHPPSTSDQEFYGA